MLHSLSVQPHFIAQTPQMPYWSPFDFWKLPTPLLLVDCLACIFPALPVAGLLSPFSSQFKWYRGREASYLKLAFMFMFFTVLLAVWNGLNLSDYSFYTCFQSHNDRNCIYHSFLLFCTLPKHIGNEMLGKFHLLYISLENPLSYYLYSENCYYKTPC